MKLFGTTEIEKYTEILAKSSYDMRKAPDAPNWEDLDRISHYLIRESVMPLVDALLSSPQFNEDVRKIVSEKIQNQEAPQFVFDAYLSSEVVYLKTIQHCLDALKSTQ